MLSSSERTVCALDVAHFLDTAFLLLIAALTPIIIAFMLDKALA